MNLNEENLEFFRNNGPEMFGCHDFESFKEVFLSNVPDLVETLSGTKDEGESQEWLRRRREETLDTEGLFVAYTDNGEAHFVPTVKFLKLSKYMRLSIMQDWLDSLTDYYNESVKDWEEEKKKLGDPEATDWSTHIRLCMMQELEEKKEQ